MERTFLPKQGTAMRRLFAASLALIVAIQTTQPARAADYTIDPAHTNVSFTISHLGLTKVVGRFNDVAGKLNLNQEDAKKSSLNVVIQSESIDTNQKQRDEHLRTPDFFDVEKFPTITFVSTGAKAVEGGLEVTGEFTLHGVTKPLTLTLKGGEVTEFPQGVQRTGYSAATTIKRSDYGMKTMLGPIGDEVGIYVHFEATLDK